MQQTKIMLGRGAGSPKKHPVGTYLLEVIKIAKKQMPMTIKDRPRTIFLQSERQRSFQKPLSGISLVSRGFRQTSRGTCKVRSSLWAPCPWGGVKIEEGKEYSWYIIKNYSKIVSIRTSIPKIAEFCFFLIHCSDIFRGEKNIDNTSKIYIMC